MRRPGAPLIPAFLAITMVAILPGCRIPETARPTGRQPAPVEGERTVPLDVMEGPEGGTLALIPVRIQGQGPFRFALDTGATRTVVDQEIARQLNLQVVGRTRAVAGVVSAAEAEQVRVREWSMGDVSLPSTTILSMVLPRTGEGNGERILGGLLGSDVLSEYGAIVIDYDRQELVLRPHR